MDRSHEGVRHRNDHQPERNNSLSRVSLSTESELMTVLFCRRPSGDQGKTMCGLYKPCSWFGGDSKGISLDHGRILRSREEGVAGHFTPLRPTDGGSYVSRRKVSKTKDYEPDKHIMPHTWRMSLCGQWNGHVKAGLKILVMVR